MCIRDSNCVDDTTETVEVFDLPIVDFVSSIVCENEPPTQFTDLSQGNPGNVIVWAWDFGDGESSTLQNPMHVYATDGTYNTQLIVTSDSGCVDSTTISIIVNPKPAADFSFVDDCVYLPLVVNDSTTIPLGTVVGLQWDFGDGNTSTSFTPSHTYLNDGIYNVTLIAVSDSGCLDTIVKVTERYPTPIASLINPNACLGDSNCFADNSFINPSDTITSYSWDFGDGSPFGSNSNTCHLYPTPGVFNVALEVTSNHNCVDDTTETVEVFDLPIVDFVSSIVCENEPPTQFTDLSQGNPGNVIVWAWDFGDGGSSILQNPTHVYASDGTYNTQLIVTSDSGCVDSTTIS